MRDRLIKILEKFDYYAPCDKCTCGIGYCEQCKNERYAEYLFRNGVIVPPVEIGQIVYPLNADRRFKAVIEQITLTEATNYYEWAQYDVGVDGAEIWDADCFTDNDIGKTVFLNESEYLKALAERSSNERTIER